MGIGGQVGSLAGSIVGDLASMKNDAAIDAALKRWVERYKNLPPSERVNAKPVGRSELGGVQENATYRQAEDEALRRLMESATSGGMTPADKAKLEQAKLSGLDYERGTRGAMESSLRRRGMGGSGANIAGDIAAQQGGVDRAYRGDVQTAADSSDRALAALAAAGGFASHLSGKDLARQSNAAEANDRISAFNAGRGDRSDFYNSRLAHEDTLDQNRGLDAKALAEMGQNNKWAEYTRKAGQGYGEAVGGIFDSIGGMAGGGG